MSFSTGAPGCCCCNDIWHNGVGQYGVKPTDINPISPFGGVGDYDPVNRVSFAGSLQGTVPFTIYKRIEQTEDTHTLWFTGPTGSETQGPCACNPATERLYYNQHFNASTDNFIRRLDYDATNDTAIATIVGLSTTVPNIYQLVYHRVLDRLYYSKRAKNGALVDTIYIAWIDAAGGAENLIYDIPLNSQQNNVTSLELDYINEKVWWVETIVSGGTTVTIRRCDYDGANTETVHTCTAPLDRCGGLQVSYKQQCLITFDYNSAAAAAADTDGGLFKRDFDYAEVERVYARDEDSADMPAGGVFANFRLGCGFETLGANNEG